jgi:protein-S-isoprenylcysteine O-methyltransferase Ste14
VFIVQIVTKLGIPQFSFSFQKIVAAILFVILSSIGISAAISMSKIGQGTPLPFDTAKKLVVKGIYSFVRNPMAISGIGQGLMVALFLGSPLVFLYTLMGAFIWQLIFRPLEEEDLLKNFGADYENYQENVRCWIPNFKRFELKN